MSVSPGIEESQVVDSIYAAVWMSSAPPVVTLAVTVTAFIRRSMNSFGDAEIVDVNKAISEFA
jgi:hypothetical protein